MDGDDEDSSCGVKANSQGKFVQKFARSPSEVGSACLYEAGLLAKNLDHMALRVAQISDK